jgi:hypothetical protein
VPDRSTASPRRKLLWALIVTVASGAAIAAAPLHGHASRIPFRPPPEMTGPPVAMVGDAADALRVWRTAGVRGRRLVVLTGQWSRPRDAKARPPTPEELSPRREGGDLVDAGSAVYAAGVLGIARRMDVVMPAAAFTHRMGEVRGLKGLVREDGAFRLPYHGLERRFSTTAAFVAPTEPALVLVEPSWFTDGAGPEPLGWLAERGVKSDLALVAMDDPAATAKERLAAEAFGRAAGASFLEAER